MSSVRTLAAALGLAFVATAITACPLNEDGLQGGSVVADDAGDSGDGGKPAMVPCSEPADQRPPGSACVRTVSGRLSEDTTGASLKLLTTVCGTGLCLYGEGTANGDFTVPVNRFVDLSAFVVHVDGRPTHANVYFRLAPSSSEIAAVGDIRVPRLDQVGPALPKTPPGAKLVVTAGNVALSLPPTAAVELDFADAALDGDEGRKLRSGRVSSQVLSDPKLLVLYALSPFAATVAPAADVSITLPAEAAIADGTILELVALEDTLDNPQTGTLKVVGTATVTAGVARSDPGSGLTRLTWVGVRKKGT